MFSGKTWQEWVGQYEESHRHPVNRSLHLVGIPLIATSILLFPVCFIMPGFWPVPVTLFILGWVFQFVGHAIEGKPPEFFRDWRFLFVGLRWWFVKIRRNL